MSEMPPPRICERCFSAIAPDEEYLRLAHVGSALPDGSIQWLDTFVHTTACVPSMPRRDPRRTVHVPSVGA